MAFGVNRATGRPGPAPQPPRDGDKVQARQRINVEVRTGRRPRPNTIPCVDCGHVWKAGERRHEYDHHLGYKAEHHYDVQAVCTRCQRARSVKRGEWAPPNWKGKKRPGQNDRRPRDPATGAFVRRSVSNG
jgi:hypothetical protein